MNRVAPSLALMGVLVLAACRARPAPAITGPLQTERDERLVYDLLDPYDHAFRVTYELAATTPGALVYYTPVRGDTFVSAVSAVDVHTEQRLDVALVSGADARAKGHPAAQPGGSYFAIALDRPVPEGGEVRLCVEATYEDRESYAFFQDEMTFTRLLAAEDVTVVLPKDRELLECNQPCTIAKRADGRVVLRYVKRGRAPVPLRIHAREIASTTAASSERGERARSAGAEAPALGAPAGALASETIGCEVLDPERRLVAWRHSIELRAERGERAETLRALVPGRVLAAEVVELDTGARVADVAVARGASGGHAPASADRIEWPSTSAARLVVRAKAESSALACDARSFSLDADASRVRTIVVPAGWNVVGCAVPASVTTLADGRKELELVATSVRASAALDCERVSERARD